MATRPRRRRPRFERVALQEGRRAGLRNPHAFVRQMRVEAHGQDLTSPAGAEGPAQITPGTARAWGLTPRQVHSLRPSYRAAAQHMAGYERQFGSTRAALVAYNAGPGRVGGPLPAETQNYIRTILPNGERVARRRRAPGSSPGRVPRSGTTTTTRNVTRFDQAGYDEAVRRQRLATFLQQSGRGNSVLFRSGLLSTEQIDPSTFRSTQQVTSRVRAQPMTPGAVRGQLDREPAADDVGRAVRAARRRLGIAEVNNSNRGREVDKMQRSYGMIGQPWCGIFVGTVLRHAGVRTDSRVASVAEIERMARARTGGFEGGFHSARNARRGDALITRQGQHVAFVTRVDRDGTIHVIGGNQADGRVTRATYRADQVYGVARPRYRRR